MYYDINGVKAYSEMMKDKYKNRKHTDNVFPVGITDAEFRKAIIDIFCGVDWYISYPGSQAQVNEEAIETILRRITMREFRQTEYYRALYSVPINLVKEKAVDFKTACAEWWEELSEYDKQLIREMPNFDAEIFEEITGIKEEK